MGTNIKALAIVGAAAAIAGVAATVAVPYAAAKVVNVNDPANWWAPGAIAVAAGLAVVAVGKGNPAAIAAGAALAGVGGSWAYLTYKGTHLATTTAAAPAATTTATTTTTAAPATTTAGQLAGAAWRGNPARFQSQGARYWGTAAIPATSFQGAGVRRMQYG